MARQLHFGKTYQIHYDYGGMYGSDGQDALYDIFRMFDIENNAEDIYTDDYEVEREELKRLRQMLTDKGEEFKANGAKLNKCLEKAGLTLDKFVEVVDDLINNSDQSNEYVLISWY